MKFFLCLSHLLWGIFILYVRIIFLIYINKFTFTKVPWLHIQSRQRHQSASSAISSMLPFTFILISLSSLSFSGSLLHVRFCCPIPSFSYPYLRNVMWVYHWKTKSNTYKGFAVYTHM